MYVLVAAVLGGCVSLHPINPVVDGPGGVRVLVRAQDDELFALEVVNYGKAPIVVDRDRVVLVTPGGSRARLTVGAGSLDTVPPGGRDALDLRFSVGRIHAGERVALGLAGALSQSGEQLMMPSLEFVAD